MRSSDAVSRSSGRRGTNAVHAVDEHREDDPEGDDRDEHPIANAQDHDQRGHESDRRRCPQELDERLERLPCPPRRPHRNTNGDADRSPDRISRRQPPQARPDMAQELWRRPVMPRALYDGARRRHEEGVAAPCQRLPDRDGRSEDDPTEDRPADALDEAHRHRSASRSSPDQNTSRRSAARSARLTM